MKLRVTAPAARQLERLLDYIDARHPLGAQNVQRCIREIMQLLLRHPLTGHATSRSHIRRIVTFPYPYAIFYEVGEDEIIIHAIRHTARRRVT